MCIPSSDVVWTQHVAALLRGVITLGPLPLTARAAVLQFTTGETVRVPLNLAPLRRLPAFHGPLLRRAGLQLQVVAARDTSLVLDLSPFGIAHGETLADGRARLVPFRVVASGCSATGFADGPLACREVWTYPPQPHGAPDAHDTLLHRRHLRRGDERGGGRPAAPLHRRPLRRWALRVRPHPYGR